MALIAPLSRRLFLGAGPLALAQLAVRPGAAAPVDIEPIIDEQRKTILAAMTKEAIPGVAVALIYKGEVAWTEGFGVTGGPGSRPVDTDTIFSIQSISKNFTATAIMLAVQDGILDLDAPIGTYIPDFTVHSRHEKSPEKKMTLRLLLSHRAGFTHEAPVGANFDPASPGFEAHVRSISDTWLCYPVGERYAYSNLGFDLAGYILQRASGMPFAQWLKTRLFDLLGMTSSTVDSRVYSANANRAIGHAEGYDSVPLVIPIIPSGGVYASAKDMTAYARFHLGRGTVPGKEILQRRLWDEMHAFPFGPYYSLGVAKADPVYERGTVRELNHNGGGFGFGSVLSYWPEVELAWIAMFNRQAGLYGDGPAPAILTKTYGELKLASAKDLPLSANLPEATLADFVGSYLLQHSLVQAVLKDGAIETENEGGLRTRLTFVSPIDACYVRPQGGMHFMHHHPGKGPEAAWFELPDGPGSLDYNDGPNDMLGPNKPEWNRYLGDYEIDQWGKPIPKARIEIRNGYLYLDKVRMIDEHEPGLFFSGDGEALDLRGPSPTWRNIRLRKLA